MRTATLVLLFALFASRSHGQELLVGDLDKYNVVGRTVNSVLDFDIIQRSCALYVAVRSSAWNRPIAFGGEMNENMVHWNFCPGGDKVACAAPIAVGDTIVHGIPWRH